MTYQQAKARADELEAACKAAGLVLRAFPKGIMGLTLDAVKTSPEYRAAKRDYDAAFTEMHDFNAYFMRTYRREYQAERKFHMLKGKKL